jgi:hypothetical protein
MGKVSRTPYTCQLPGGGGSSLNRDLGYEACGNYSDNDTLLSCALFHNLLCVDFRPHDRERFVLPPNTLFC